MRDNSRHISLCLEMLSDVRITFSGTVVVEEDHIQEHKKDRGVLVKLHVVVFILLHSSYIHGSLYRYITPFGYDCIVFRRTIANDFHIKTFRKSFHWKIRVISLIQKRMTS